MNKFHVKHFPPGMDMEGEKLFFQMGMLASFLYSLTFLWRYVQARAQLYDYVKGKYILVEERAMETFFALLGNALIGFGLVAIAMVGFAVVHYVYFWQGSKSIYLMKRLPDRMELYRRVFTMPLIGILICMAAGVLLLIIYYSVYLIATPNVWPNQWLFG